MNPGPLASRSPTTTHRPVAGGELKGAVQSFWNAHPCGAKFAGQEQGTDDFFRAVEEQRYRLEPHIREMAAFDHATGKRVLEIGCGLGTDGAQFVKAGAQYVGMDLSPASVLLARKNLQLQDLPANWLISDAESLPFPDGAFDVVYSNGVLHHTRIFPRPSPRFIAFCVPAGAPL